MIVLDASAAIDWLLQTAAGQRIERRIYAHNESLHAPHLLDLEVGRHVQHHFFLIAGVELLKPWPLQIVIDYVLGGKTPPSAGPLAQMLALPPGLLLKQMEGRRLSPP